jgi:hypothetical protein
MGERKRERGRERERVRERERERKRERERQRERQREGLEMRVGKSFGERENSCKKTSRYPYCAFGRHLRVILVIVICVVLVKSCNICQIM